MVGNSIEDNNMPLDDLIEDILFSDSDQPDVMSSSDQIKDFLFDDLSERQLQLVLQLHRQSSFSSFRKRIDRDHEAGHECLSSNYFAPNPIYPHGIF